MKLTSLAFREGQEIPTLYTCDGKEISPPLQMAQVPANAKSLALIMHDPDVPSFIRSDCLWVHWVVFNLPAQLQSIGEGAALPSGVAGKGTGGVLGYQGPCPPDRRHRYFFTLYALDALLDVPEGATRAEVERAMQGHVLAKAQLMGTYERVRRQDLRSENPT